MGHIDLAPDLHHLGCAVHLLRNVGDRAGVCQHVFADLAIATGGGLHQFASLVAQVQRQAVNLGLRGVGHLGYAEEPLHPRVEIDHFRFGEGILQAQHPHPMGHFAEARGNRSADLIRRGVGPPQLRKPRLDGQVPAFERVIIGVRNLGRVQRVIGGVGGAQTFGQARKFGAGFGFGQIRHQLFHHLPPGSRTGYGGAARNSSLSCL